jgi:hypothetical protein
MMVHEAFKKFGVTKDVSARDTVCTCTNPCD